MPHPKTAGTDAENNTRYYIFENVTRNHTLAAYFETIPTSGDGSDSSSGNTLDTSLQTGISVDACVINISNTAPTSKDNEPKTGYASYIEIYATIAMIVGLSYLLLYFVDGKNGITEEGEALRELEIRRYL